MRLVVDAPASRVMEAFPEAERVQPDQLVPATSPKACKGPGHWGLVNRCAWLAAIAPDTTVVETRDTVAPAAKACLAALSTPGWLVAMYLYLMVVPHAEDIRVLGQMAAALVAWFLPVVGLLAVIVFETRWYNARIRSAAQHGLLAPSELLILQPGSAAAASAWILAVTTFAQAMSGAGAIILLAGSVRSTPYSVSAVALPLLLLFLSLLFAHVALAMDGDQQVGSLFLVYLSSSMGAGVFLATYLSLKSQDVSWAGASIGNGPRWGPALQAAGRAWPSGFGLAFGVVVGLCIAGLGLAGLLTMRPAAREYFARRLSRPSGVLAARWRAPAVLGASFWNLAVLGLSGVALATIQTGPREVPASKVLALVVSLGFVGFWVNNLRVAAANLLRKRRQARRLPLAPEGLQAECLDLARVLGVGPHTEVRIDDSADSEARVWAPILPRQPALVILPGHSGSRSAGAETRFVLAHEVAHLASRRSIARLGLLSAAALMGHGMLTACADSQIEELRADMQAGGLCGYEVGSQLLRRMHRGNREATAPRRYGLSGMLRAFASTALPVYSHPDWELRARFLDLAASGCNLQVLLGAREDAQDART